MCAAARTAPKAHGKDTIHTMVLTGEEKEALAVKMDAVGLSEMGEKAGTWYRRDSSNVRKAQALVLIGVDNRYRDVPHCSYCGLVFPYLYQAKIFSLTATFSMINLEWQVIKVKRLRTLPSNTHKGGETRSILEISES